MIHLCRHQVSSSSRQMLRACRTRIHSTSTKPKGLAWPLAVPTGLMAGSISALAGVGGGILIIPIIAKFSTLPQRIINATSIMAVTGGASVGATSYLLSDSCNLPVATILAGSSIFTTGFGIRLAQRLSNRTLSALVGIAMLSTVPLILAKESTVDATAETGGTSHDWQRRLETQWKSLTLNIHRRVVPDGVPDAWKSSYQIAEYASPYIVAGLLSGFLSGLLGLGGGILMTSYLTTATDMPQAQVVGTSLLAIVPIGMSACLHNVRLGVVHYPTALAIGSGLSLSVWLTSKYVTLQIEEAKLRQVFAATLAISSVAMLRRTLLL